MLTLAVALTVGGTALAQVSPELEKAQGQVDAGDFEDAIATLEKGLQHAELTDDQLVEMYRLLGLSHLYLGHEDQARGAFEKLLQARPDYEVPKSAPPKIRSLYGRIKEDIKKRRVRPVTLTLDPVQRRMNQPLVVSAQITDLALGAKAKLFYRRPGAQAYSSVDFRREKGREDRFAALVPEFELPKGEILQYYVEVADAAQRRLAGRGDAYNPLSVEAPEQIGDPQTPRPGEERPWYKIPWVWVGVGVGVAAIATTAAVLATQKQSATVQIDLTVRMDP